MDAVVGERGALPQARLNGAKGYKLEDMLAGGQQDPVPDRIGRGRANSGRLVAKYAG
jgi:hypothetical protein